MILDKKKPSVWRSLEDWLGLNYYPDDPKYRNAPKPDTPPTTRRQPTQTTRTVGENVEFNPRLGKWLRENVGQNTDNNADKTTDTKRRVADNKPSTPTTLEWDVLSTPTNTVELNNARQEKLTDAEKILLRERGLDEAKGQTIKHFWHKKISRELTAATLSRQAKGYSDRIIKEYFVVFNSALKNAESPTLEAK